MKLSDETITQQLASIPDWHRDNDNLVRDFKFTDFKTAFAFMTAVAALAEKLGHHPDWSNVYNRVHISLSTHDVGGISELDFEMARQIDAAAALD